MGLVYERSAWISVLFSALLAVGCSDDNASTTDDGGSSSGGETDPSTSTTTTSTSTSTSTTGSSSSSSSSTTTGTGTDTDGTSTTGNETDGGTGGALDCVDEDLGSEVGTGVGSGSTDQADDGYILGCAGGGGSDWVYTWTAPEDATYVFDTFGSNYDTALAVVSGDCFGEELACNDDAGGVAQSQVTLELNTDDTVVIVVDGYGNDDGDFVLNIEQIASTCCIPQNTPSCDDSACSDAVCALDSFCCDNTWDELCVGAAEIVCDACAGPGPCCHANGSPGCEDTTVETCVCAVMSSCCDTEWTQACADAVETNSCGTCNPDETCVDGDLGNATGQALATGSNVGGTDDHATSCIGAGGSDVIYTWTAPADGSYSFSSFGSDYDTGVAILFPDCAGDEWFCNDDAGGVLQSELVVPVDEGVTVLVVLDGYGTSEGDYVLNILPGPQGGDCCADNGDAGCADAVCQAAVCAIDSTCCSGTWNQGCADIADQQCQICSDDCCSAHPAPGCADTLCEATVCAANAPCCGTAWDAGCVTAAETACGVCQAPGDCCFVSGAHGCEDSTIESCVCGIDPTCCSGPWTAACVTIANDSCSASCSGGNSGPDYDCVDDDLMSGLGASVATGNNVGFGDDVFPECTAPGGEDVIYTWTAPFDGVFTFDTEGSDFDNAVAVLWPDCAGDVTACGAQFMNTTSTASTFVAAGQTVLPVVDGFGAAAGDFVLNINPAPLGGFCCTDNGTIGCSNSECMGLVCGSDPDCCTMGWDTDCETAALAVCSVCQPGQGDCCMSNGSPGCDDQTCQNTVCAADTYCCDVDWDSICVTEAQEMCGALCP